MSPGKKIRRGKTRVVWVSKCVKKEDGRTYYNKALVNGDEVSAYMCSYNYYYNYIQYTYFAFDIVFIIQLIYFKLTVLLRAVKLSICQN